MVMPRALVTYIRHAMPVTDAKVDPRAWHLDPEAERAAARLADRLEVASRLGLVVSSTEPKALETAACVGERWRVEVRGDDRLREVERPWVGSGYRSVAHRYLRGQAPDGWEPHADAAGRAQAAVDEAVEGAAGEAVAVVSHGLLLAVHLGALLGDDFDRESFWSGLAFPDAWCLDDAGMLHRPQPRVPSR